MIDPSPHPSRQLRLLARLARWSLGLVLAFWLVLLTVWGALHGFIVPRIGEWRVEVERLATQSVGAPVRIESLQGQLHGLLPTIHLTGVSILDGQGRSALHLQKVIATISARSVLRWGVEQLYIDAPELDIRHLSNGGWQVAGLEVVDSDVSERPGLEWLLEQPELVIRQGRLKFTDEKRGLATRQLRDVDLVLRHRHWSHVLRLDATPETGGEPGERMQLVGAFRQALLPSSKAPWTRWSGQWYASLQLQQIPELPWPQAWGVAALQGSGAARVWLDIEDGLPVGMTSDLALNQARVQWRDTQVSVLEAQSLQGRFQGRWQERGWHLEGHDFSLRYRDGSLWPRSHWRVEGRGSLTDPQSTRVSLDYADVAMAAKVVHALPLPAIWRSAMARWSPRGTLHALQLQWSPKGAYQASGRVEGLQLDAQPAEQGTGIPGVEGLDGTFSVTERGGQADLAMVKGWLDFPGVFEEPRIAMDALQAQVHWSTQDGRLKVEVPQARFANADAQGHMQGFWQMGAQAEDRLPGHLQLQGQLARANGARVHRYLPLAVSEVARHYVRDSVRQGVGERVDFEVTGPLRDMPFDRPGSGRFWIHAPVKDVVYDFLPPALRAPGAMAWPALTQLQGTLLFDGSSMQVHKAETGFEGHPKLRMHSVQARIPHLQHPELSLQAGGQIELAAALGLVRQSPLSALTSHALDEAQARGQVEVAFDLALPIDAPQHTKVNGRVSLQSTDLQIQPSTPWMTQLQGVVAFHEQGFELQKVRGQALGGALEVTGGMPSVEQGVHVQAVGTATAEGLHSDRSVPLVGQLAAHAQGRTAYAVDVRARNQEQQVTVRSNLQGLALHLPAPLNKSSEEVQPLRVQQQVSAQRRQTLQVEVTGRGQVTYVQDLSATPPRVVQGQIVVGAAAPEPLSGEGVVARVELEQLDVNAWQQALAQPEGERATGAWEQAHAYLPQRVELAVQRLQIQQRALTAVRTAWAQQGGVWRGNFSAQQFVGHAEYRLPSVQGDAGHLFARLSHLSIPKSEAQRLNQVVDETRSTQPETLPAVDIEVERLEIAGKALGRLQLQALNHQGTLGRTWQLEQFDLSTAEARWRAHGVWAPAEPGKPRTTRLDFVLDMDSSGKLLERFGMPGVIRDGAGSLRGAIAWQGSPITPDWRSMDGGVQMALEQGQFLKAEPGMAKLLSVLSLQSLARRVVLDFRDVFSQGFAFDFIRGDIQVEQGVAHSNNLQMKGLNAAVLMEGQASLVDESQDLKVVVVPEINAMTASLVATAINPVVGLGSFLAQMFLRGPLMEAATRTFHVHGTWADPVVDQVSKSDAPASPRTEGVAR